LCSKEFLQRYDRKKNDEMKIRSFFDFDFKKTRWFNKENNLVLVGTVKSKEQFDICLSEKFYYIPFRFLIPSIFFSAWQLKRIKHVSIYQSVTNFKENAGINYYGTVESISVVRRSDITQIPKNSKQLYVLFKVSEWTPLDEPIKFAQIPIYPFEVFPFHVFKASKDTTELFIESTKDRELYRNLQKLSTDVNFKNFDYDEFDFEDYNDTLVITKKGECYLQLPMEVIRELPYDGYETVKNAMNG
jgi:hypothetical protein